MLRHTHTKTKLYRFALIFFFGIMALGMVIVLAPLPDFSSLETQPNVLASIDGQNITTEQLDKSVRNQMQGTTGKYIPQLAALYAPRILDSLISRRALVLQAHKLGLQVTDEEVLKAAQSIPSLYPNGKFVGDQQFELMTGVTVSQFMAEEREGLLVQKMKSLVTDGLSVSPDEVHAEFLKNNTKAKIDYVVFDPSQFVKAINVTPAALEDYFKKDPDKYRVQEQRRVRYVLVTPDRLRAEAKVTDQDLRQYYSQHLSDYRVPDRVHLERILFKTTGKSPAEVTALTKKAQDDLAKIKSGKSFEDIAKADSEDPNASKGGDAGWIQRGQLEQQVETAAFALSQGQVSDVIKTDYALEIVKVVEKQTAHLQSFDEIKDQIQASLEKQKLAVVQQNFGDTLDQKLKADPQHFTDIAKAAGLEVQETPPFSYRQVVPDFGNSQSFSDLAFQLRPNEVGQAFTVPKGTAIIQLVQIIPAHVPPLDQIRGAVEEDYRAAQAKVLASQKATEFAAKAASGDFKAVAKSMGLTDKESKDFSQQESVEGLGPASSLAAAFKLDPGKTSAVVNMGANEVVFRVLSRTPANEADFAAQKDPIAQQLLDQKQELAFELYTKDLKQQLIKSGQLKMNEATMKQFLANYQREGTS